MQTRREYLVGLGLAKPGRGKFSTKGKEAIAKAEAEGMVFAETNATAPKAKVIDSDKPAPEPVPADPGNSLYLHPSDFRFPEAEYEAIGSIDGKRVVYSMRECCNTCMVSLTNHMCNTPSVLGNVAVVIKARKGVTA